MRTSCINPCFYPLLNSGALASAKQIAFINFYYGILALLMAINCYLLHMLCVATLAVVVVVVAASIAVAVVVTGSCWSARDYLERATSAKCQYIFISLEILHICNTHTKTGNTGRGQRERERWKGNCERKRVEIVWGISFTKLNLFCQRCKRPKGAMSKPCSAAASLCVCVAVCLCEWLCVCVCVWCYKYQ